MRYIALVLILIFVGVDSNAQEPVEDDARTSKIIIYGSDSCHYCIETKSYLKEEGVAFTYYDIDVNEEKLKEILVKLKNNNMSAANIQLPIIDKKGELFMNNTTFEEFLEKIIK